MRAYLLVSLMIASVSVKADCTNRYILSSKPVEAYVDYSDGTLLDLETGLMWQKCELGKSGELCEQGSASMLSWKDALDQVNNNTQYGYSDWRLPNVKELNSLIDVSCENPPINDQVFINASNINLWSSTPSILTASSAKEAWAMMNFGMLRPIAKDTLLGVRLVRDY